MMSNLKNILLVAVFIVGTATVSGNTPVTACENGVLPTTKVISAGKECLNDPCIVHPGTNVSLEMNFTSPTSLENIVPKVVVHYEFINIPYPLEQKNACEGITNASCPIGENEDVHYELSLNLFSYLPSIQLGLTFSIIDKNNPENETVVCFNMNLQVQHQQQ